MKTSPQGLAMLQSFEGCKLSAYRDGRGVWTIGYGHTRGVAEGLTCLQAQADAWLAEDIAPAEQGVTRLVQVPLVQGQFDALASFAFNCGVAALAASTLLRKLNAHDYRGAADEFPRWVHDAPGNVEPGLVARRAKERALFLQGVTA
jgi:lysozyme